MNPVGVLLINLGTPDAPTPEAVGRYLRQFLMDGFVIDVPKPLRWFLVNVMIVPRRKGQSAKAYQKVQLLEGSPLRVYTRELTEKVTARLAVDGDRFVVEYAMRYGNPSIASSLERLRSHDVSRIIVMPMYPQYAESSYRTAVEETKKQAGKLGLADRLSFFPVFYDRPEFISAYAHRVHESVQGWPVEHFIFSFHSLPVRHLKRLDATQSHCLIKSDCCDAISAVNQNCYRAQCIFTARAMARELGLKDDGYSISFQSRLGRAEWLGPQTEDVLRKLAESGFKRVAVSCPSFVADCLETVEEIGIRARDNFIQAGGEELRLVPSLNSDPVWVETVVEWIRELCA
ncbi:MAG TPA: ferrochelatase, partial [Pyrinomonadaceae bacterium]|nr:ferrochelatase [Pyrinomonadaceae bacterium]